jgi:hypothetical protein
MKSKDQQLLEEAYTKAYTSPAKFDYETFVFYDRSMQPGGGPGMADWIDSPEDLKDALAAAKKVRAPHGVEMWEDTEGNILIKVK